MARKRQGMQKYVQEHYANTSDSSTFGFETISADLDEEVLFKRIRINCSSIPLDQSTLAAISYVVINWALIQADTAITPAAADMSDNNRVIVTGQYNLLTGTQTYDHTITMRKLKSSSIYLLWELQNPTNATLSVGNYAYLQLHYLED